VCVWADRGRQKRAWIIDSFTIEEENPGPFPYILGKVSGFVVQFQLICIMFFTLHMCTSTA